MATSRISSLRTDLVPDRSRGRRLRRSEPLAFAREDSATPSAVHRLVPVASGPLCCGRPPVGRGRIGPSAGALRGQVVLRPEGRDMATFGVGRVEEVHLGVDGGWRRADGSVRFNHDRTLRRQHVPAHSSRGTPIQHGHRLNRAGVVIRVGVARRVRWKPDAEPFWRRGGADPSADVRKPVRLCRSDASTGSSRDPSRPAGTRDSGVRV